MIPMTVALASEPVASNKWSNSSAIVSYIVSVEEVSAEKKVL